VKTKYEAWVRKLRIKRTIKALKKNDFDTQFLCTVPAKEPSRTEMAVLLAEEPLGSKMFPSSSLMAAMGRVRAVGFPLKRFS